MSSCVAIAYDMKRTGSDSAFLGSSNQMIRLATASVSGLRRIGFIRIGQDERSRANDPGSALNDGRARQEGNGGKQLSGRKGLVAEEVEIDGLAVPEVQRGRSA